MPNWIDEDFVDCRWLAGDENIQERVENYIPPKDYIPLTTEEFLAAAATMNAKLAKLNRKVRRLEDKINRLWYNHDMFGE